MRTENISRQNTHHGCGTMPAVLRSIFSTVPVVTLFVFVLTANWANAQSKNDARIELSCRDKIPVWMAEHKVPTVGVAVIEDGKLKEVKVFGELRQDVPAPVNTLFGVASLTKPVTAVVTLKLVDAGKWDLDEPLSNYWVDPDVKDDPRLKQLTTRLVLSHQTGFPNWRQNKKLAFEFEPGTKYQYSGEGFEYLRRAVERKLNKPFGKIAESLLFAPLDMKDTGYHWTDAMDQFRIAIAKDTAGHTLFPWIPSTANAAASLLTTVEDYGKFGIEVIKGAGLSQKLYSEMSRPQVSIPDSTGLSHGLGWAVAKDLSSGEYALLHRGGHVGVRALVLLLPKSKRGLVVLTNGENGEAVCNKIAMESIDVGKEIIQKGKKNLPEEKHAGASKYVKLVHADTGKVLGIADKSDDAGANAVLAQDDGSLAHQWRLEKQGDYYKIVNRKSGKVLDVLMESTEEGGAIIQWDDKEGGDNDNQRWSWDGKDTARRLRSKSSTLVLDVGGDGAIVQRKANEKAKGQLWRMVEIKEQQK
jgi:CubicO group peptidase (beta-lactamase class C family)